ncbi:PDR/VanB family oxidoreductase [Nocardia brasiliensis]|uniref:PDR/VanB family oxidoreductase n=1 Tax=Nocardia brasiliensis TaxID=37326 RepID=UPI00366B777B
MPVESKVPPHLHGRFRRDPLLRLLRLGRDAVMWAEKYTHLPVPNDGPFPEFIEARVIERRGVTADGSVIALTVQAANGSELPAWFAGSHVDLRLPSGLVRQYSLCGNPADRATYRIAVRHLADGRGGSAEVHRALTVGAVVRIGLPRNAFPLAIGGWAQQLSAIRFIVGGIGITPILPMLDILERAGIDWSMVYCGRSRASLAFLDELERYGERVLVHTDDERGVATPEILLGDLSGKPAVYTCGPAPMIDTLCAALASRPDIECHYERFAPAPVVDGREFEIHFARTGEVVTVAADQTALSAILTARPDATYSCQQGFCRSCAVRVLDGEVTHRSTSLSPTETEQGYFLPCVSRAESRLTVDM